MLNLVVIILEMVYNTFHSKKIAVVMVEQGEVSVEFTSILDSFTEDLVGKLPRF